MYEQPLPRCTNQRRIQNVVYHQIQLNTNH
nr:MAG TPA: hypothetical protein [Caudoviricetes sp.]